MGEHCSFWNNSTVCFTNAVPGAERVTHVSTWDCLLEPLQSTLTRADPLPADWGLGWELPDELFPRYFRLDLLNILSLQRGNLRTKSCRGTFEKSCRENLALLALQEPRMGPQVRPEELWTAESQGPVKSFSAKAILDQLFDTCNYSTANNM